MAAALSQLETRVGVAINYEDVPYCFAQGTSDVAQAVMNADHRAAHPNAQVIAPKGGPLSFTAVQPPVANMLSVSRIISSLVEASNSQRYTGVYQASIAGGAFFVTPTEMQNSSGSLVPAVRALDTTVTLPLQERSAAETVDLILSQVAQSGRTQVGVGMVPMTMMLESKVLVRAESEPARSVLGRGLSLLSSETAADGSVVPAVGYQLLCDPASHNCALNIHIVRGAKVN